MENNENLEQLKKKLQNAIDSLDLFNKKKECYIFNIHDTDNELRSFFSILCPKHDIKEIETAINEKQYEQLEKIAKNSILNELLDTFSLHNTVQNKNTTYNTACDDANSTVGIFNEQGNPICSISFEYNNYIRRNVPKYGGVNAYMNDQFPTILLSDNSYLSAYVCKEKGYRLEYNDQPIENVNNDDELKKLHLLANKYTLTELYYYINALTYHINNVKQEPPSKDDILNAMREANKAVQEKKITDQKEYEEQQEYKEQDEENSKYSSDSGNNNIKMTATMKTEEPSKTNLLSQNRTSFPNKDSSEHYESFSDINSDTNEAGINNNNSWKNWFKTTPPFSWCYSCCRDGNER